MLQIFKTNQFSTGVLLIFYAIVLKVGTFFAPPFEKADHITGYLNERLSFLMPDTFLLQYSIGIFIIFLGGFLISILVIRQRLEIEATLYSNIFYILTAAIIFNYTQISGLGIGMVFLILALQNLLSSPNKIYNSIFIFNVGLLIGLASLFYWSLWVFIIWAILSVFQLLGAKIKEGLMLLTGFVIPLFYQGLDYFKFGRFAEFKEDLLNKYLGIDHFGLYLPNGINQWIITGVILFLLLLSFFNYQKNTQKKQVIIRRKINVIYWMIPFSFIAIMIQQNGQFSDFILLSIPLSVMLAFQFSRFNSGFRELAHFILMGVAIYLSLDLF